MPRTTSLVLTRAKRDSTLIGRPPRPPNAFIIFRSKMMTTLDLKSIVPNQRDISRVASYLWNDLPEAHKEPYYKAADLMKQQHQVEYPDYQFCPSPAKRRKGKSRTQSREEDITSAQLIANAIKATYSSATNPFYPPSLPTFDNAQSTQLASDATDSQSTGYESFSSFTSQDTGGSAHWISEGTTLDSPSMGHWESMQHESNSVISTNEVGAGNDQVKVFSNSDEQYPIPETVSTLQFMMDWDAAPNDTFLPAPESLPAFENLPLLPNSSTGSPSFENLLTSDSSPTIELPTTERFPSIEDWLEFESAF